MTCEDCKFCLEVKHKTTASEVRCEKWGAVISTYDDTCLKFKPKKEEQHESRSGD